MKRLLFVVGAAAVLTMTSCSKEESLDGGPQAAGGHLVSLTLNGSAGMPGPVSRAASGQTLAATEAEKKISSLLAVAFNKGGDADGKLYGVFEVNIADSEYSFDMKKSGAFDVWFVANADETCKNAITGLEVGTATEDNLNQVISSQAPDANDQFLMVSVDSKEIRTNDGATTKVTVTMQRASGSFRHHQRHQRHHDHQGGVQEPGKQQ